MKFGCTYFGNRIIRHAAADMKMLRQLGFNYVVHTFSEFDLQFNRDTMRDIIAATREAGLEVHIDPWGVGNVFGGEPYSNFACLHLLDGCQVLDNGNPAPLACPNNPLFRDFMKEWFDAAAYCKADVLFIDEPHFHSAAFLGGRPGRWGCLCPYCQDLFKEKYGHPMPGEETVEVQNFKEESLISFTAMLLEWADEAGMRNSLYLPPKDSPEKDVTHWRRHLDALSVDCLGTGPYWAWRNEPVSMVGDYSRALNGLCEERGIESQVWIQVCRIAEGKEGEIAEAISLAAEAGVHNLAFWGFEGCSQESWIACQEPEKCWSATLAAMKRLYERK